MVMLSLCIIIAIAVVFQLNKISIKNYVHNLFTKKQNKTKKNPTKKTHTHIKGYRVISPHDKIHP